MKSKWVAPTKEVACAAKWFRKERGCRIRGPKIGALSNVFWADSELVLVQVNPHAFPDPVSHSVRELIEQECRLTGTYHAVTLVSVRSEPDEVPVVLKTKNLDGHVGLPSHLNSSG